MKNAIAILFALLFIRVSAQSLSEISDCIPIYIDTAGAVGIIEINTTCDTAIQPHGEPIVKFDNPPYIGAGYLLKANPGRTGLNTKQNRVAGWMQHENFRIKNYSVTHAKILGWSLVCAAGFVDGVANGFEYDGRESINRKLGGTVPPISFAGSQSWKLAYRNNDPSKGLIPIYNLTGAPDLPHVLDDLRKATYIGGGMFIGIGGAQTNKRFIHYAADFTAGLIASGLFKYAGLFWIRN